jgi:cell shape-determining protein MreD
MIFVLLIFLINLFLPANKAFAYFSAFVFGMITDYLLFRNLGEGSLIFLFLVFVYFLYQKKFRTESYLFQMGSFVCFSIFYQIIYLFKFDFYRVFWYSFFYLFFVFIKFSVLRNRI